MKKIKLKCKLFFRNKSITTLLILGLLVSYFIVINGVAMLSQISEEQKKSSIEEYENERKFILAKYVPEECETTQAEMYDEKYEETLRTLATGKGNLMLIGCGVNVGNTLKGVYADIVYSLEKDTVNKKIISGRMPSEEEIDSKEKVALVSSDMKKYIEEKDSISQIEINNVKYKVTGIFETNDMSSTRADVILFKDTFTDEDLTTMVAEQGYVGVSYSGDITETDYQALLQKIRSAGEIADEAINTENQENKNRVLFNKIFMAILFAFSIINCMVISDVWINSRFRELIIRKTMGYSVMQIINLLLCDLLKYSSVSILSAAVMQLLTVNVFMQGSLNMEYSINNMICLILALAGVVSISLIVPIIKLKKTLPARKING